MTDSDFEMAREYASEDEVELQPGKLFDEAQTLIRERIQGLSDASGRSYRVLHLAFSKSEQFEFIARARIQWDVDGQNVVFVEVICRDYQGRQGGLGAIEDRREIG